MIFFPFGKFLQLGDFLKENEENMKIL